MANIPKPAAFSNAPTDDAIDFNRRMGARLMQQGTSTEPVGHWTAALARALQGMSGGMWNAQATQGEQDAEASVQAALSGKMSPQQLMLNPRTRQYGMQLYGQDRAESRAEARERRAEERAARDPMRKLEMDYKRAMIEKATKVDPVEQMIVQRLGRAGQGGAMPGAAQPVAPGYQPIPPQGGPRLQPQSNVVPEVMPGGVTRVSDPQQQAPVPQPQMTPEKPMVDTPYGRMSVDEARELGGMMMLNPKFAQAGKAIIDSIGPQAQGGLQKPTVNAIEEKQLNSTERLSRLNQIEQSFDPRYLTLPEQIRQKGLSWKAYLTGNLPPQEAERRKKYVEWQQNTLTNLNLTIKEITGAAMGVEEAKRIILTEVNPDDDPVQFQAKLKNSLNSTRLALIRYNYLKSKNFTGGAEEAANALPLSQMNTILEERRGQIYNQLKQANPQAPEQKIMQETGVRLRREFGI